MTDSNIHPLRIENLESIKSILTDNSSVPLLFLRGHLLCEKIFEVALTNLYTPKKLSKSSFSWKSQEFEKLYNESFPNTDDLYESVISLFEVIKVFNSIRNEIAHEIKTSVEFISSILVFSDMVLNLSFPKTASNMKNDYTEEEYIEFAIITLTGRISAITADLIDLEFDSEAAKAATAWAYYDPKKDSK